MLVRILGSAAGGGFPQWNCHCETCEAARAGARALPRTQSSLAVRGVEGPWFLVNASSQAGEQLETLAPHQPGVVRSTPIAGVLLTDAEIEHTAGLLLMRESNTPVRIFGSADVGRALSHAFPVLTILQRYCAAEWETLDAGRATTLEGSSLVVERFAVGGDAPRYLGGPDAQFEPSGFAFIDTMGGGSVAYVPVLGRLDDDVLTRFATSDLVLVDGTFWSEDELGTHGISSHTAREMGHVPLSGPGGTLEALARLKRPRKVLVHINNTNPILLDDAPEHDAVLRAGVEIAHDGLEIEL